MSLTEYVYYELLRQYREIMEAEARGENIEDGARASLEMLLGSWSPASEDCQQSGGTEATPRRPAEWLQ